MGKAIRNFKDALAGVEEAKYRKLEEPTAPAPAQKTAEAPAQAPTQHS